MELHINQSQLNQICQVLSGVASAIAFAGILRAVFNK